MAAGVCDRVHIRRLNQQPATVQDSGFFSKGDTMAITVSSKNIVNDAIIKNISDSIHGINYGTVTITIHNSKIVQIEVSQKNRFDDVWTVQEGGGI